MCCIVDRCLGQYIIRKHLWSLLQSDWDISLTISQWNKLGEKLTFHNDDEYNWHPIDPCLQCLHQNSPSRSRWLLDISLWGFLMTIMLIKHRLNRNIALRKNVSTFITLLLLLCTYPSNKWRENYNKYTTLIQCFEYCYAMYHGKETPNWIVKNYHHSKNWNNIKKNL